MADNNPATLLDYWRRFFQTANTDIFQVINHAILVASADCPTEFITQREKIVESLFACRLNHCSCNWAKVLTSEGAVEEKGSNEGPQKESKESNENNKQSTGPEDLNLFVSKYSYGEAEALTDAIEEESRTVDEVMRIKDVLANWQDESEKVLFESLRRLQLMELSVETLHATDIGRAVSGLRKHSSKRIRRLTRALIKGWRLLVDEWVIVATASQETTKDTVDPSPAKEEDWLPFLPGLPFPPLDVGALLATQTTSMDLSKFFDGIDDDGENPKSSGEFEKNEKPQLDNITSVRKEDGEMRRQESAIKPTKPVEADQRPPMPQDNPTWLVPGRPSPQAFDPKSSATRRNQIRQEPVKVPSRSFPSVQDVSIPSEESSYQDKIEIAKRKLQERYRQAENEPAEVPSRSSSSVQDLSKPSEELSYRDKIEIAKRKLEERYRQAENAAGTRPAADFAVAPVTASQELLHLHLQQLKPVAANQTVEVAKKQRTIQMMELKDLPKQGHTQRQPKKKHGSHVQKWIKMRPKHA